MIRHLDHDAAMILGAAWLVAHQIPLPEAMARLHGYLAHPAAIAHTAAWAVGRVPHDIRALSGADPDTVILGVAGLARAIGPRALMRLIGL